MTTSSHRGFSTSPKRDGFLLRRDQPDFSNFSHLALARAGDVTLSISTNGRAPALARRLREELERVLGESNLIAFVERLARLRDRTPSVDRRDVLGAAVRAFTSQAVSSSRKTTVPLLEMAPPAAPAEREPPDGVAPFGVRRY